MIYIICNVLGRFEFVRDYDDRRVYFTGDYREALVFAYPSFKLAIDLCNFLNYRFAGAYHLIYSEVDDG